MGAAVRAEGVGNVDGQLKDSLALVNSLTQSTLTKLLKNGVVIDEDDPVLEHQSEIQVRQSTDGQYVETLGDQKQTDYRNEKQHYKVGDTRPPTIVEVNSAENAGKAVGSLHKQTFYGRRIQCSYSKPDTKSIWPPPNSRIQKTSFARYKQK